MMINIGFGNVVNSDKIVAIVSADSSPSKRMISTAKDENRIIDGTQGRKTQSLLVSDNNQVILSALLPETLMGRFNQKEMKPGDEEHLIKD